MLGVVEVCVLYDEYFVVVIKVVGLLQVSNLGNICG